MMNNTWILVAHRGGARLLKTRAGKGLNLLHDIRIRGQTQNKEIGADKPGRSFDSHARTPFTGSEQEPTAHS